MSDRFRFVPAPDWATDTLVDVLWSLVEQIAREQSEQPEKDNVSANVE